MQNIKFFLLTLSASVFLTGCFNIIEEVDYNSDGSGAYKMIIDMSEMKPLMDMAMAAGGEEGAEAPEDPFAEMDNAFDQTEKEVNKVAGVTKFKKMSDKENLTFGYSFAFKNLDALNKALNAANTEEGDKPKNLVYFAKEGKKKIVRKDAAGLAEKMKESLSGAGGEDAEMAISMMKEAKYQMIYRFDKKVKKVSNPLSSISSDKKTVTTDYFFFDDERGGKKGTISNEIKF